MNQKLTKKSTYSICQSRVGENLLCNFMIEKVILNVRIHGLLVSKNEISLVKWHFIFSFF